MDAYLENVRVIKKDGTKEKYKPEKIITAVCKSASRALVEFTPEEKTRITDYVNETIIKMGLIEIPIVTMHALVEHALDEVNPEVAASYRSYRNYKQEFAKMLDEVYAASQSIMYIGDKENSNADSALVSTKRSLSYNELNKRLYAKFHLTEEEKQAASDGYIYIHDQSARRDTMNCCLFDVATVLKGGFEMGNIWYTEPKTLDVAFDVIGDIILMAASQQYGGFTVSEIDKILLPYALKSLDRYTEQEMKTYQDILGEFGGMVDQKALEAKAHEKAMARIKNDFRQGFQGLEMKLNTVASSRGDYPFVTFTAGLGTHELEKMAAITMFEVRMNGQGKEGHKKPVLFPKLVMLYDEALHGENGTCPEVFDAALACSSKTMYPDWLSLTGEGYVPSIYKKYGKVISPMGCRAFLSPWYERGGIHPADDQDEPVFVGRFNVGVVSLHLPMILAKAREEKKDFFETLDYYMELIRRIHQRTFAYLGNMRASCNPLAYCEGGFYGGHLDFHDKIAPVLKTATASYGITALNELQELYNGKSLVEDGAFALEVMDHIVDKLNEYKEEDGILYAIYGTPAESLCGKQIDQFRKKYGVIEGVSSRPYVSNSFHCGVWEDISPIEKQDLEARFWDRFNGGKIQYVRYPLNYNLEAMKTLVRRAMKMGFYEGVNLSLSYCDDCGHEELEMDVCPVCGSTNLTKIDRMNGYLSYSRVHGATRLNAAKMEEIKDRVSM
ncbi:MAG TPA: anaerobic ribonucleoside-triphosphate reductase [Candidatus Faecimorpha stercoravium]|nr:anaerobic ribonucleoside-triphosphate reductase [Candidatus Faecimorpha stercoravium]